MPLSEHEQRLLAQLERQLYDTDPHLVRSLNAQQHVGRTWKRIAAAVCVGLVGLTVLLWGVSARFVPVGVAGVAIIGVGVYIGTAQPRLRRGASQASEEQRPKSTGRFFENLERQWDERER